MTGQIAFAILGAYLTGLAIERACPAGYVCPSAAYGLVVWATRPRATAAVFLANLPFALWRESNERTAANPDVAPVAYFANGYNGTNYPGNDINISLARLYDNNQDSSSHLNHNSDNPWGRNPETYHPYNPYNNQLPLSGKGTNKEHYASQNQPPRPRRLERENLFLKSCMTTFLSEFFLCFVGIPIYFYPSSANTSPRQPDPAIDRFECAFVVPGMYPDPYSNVTNVTIGGTGTGNGNGNGTTIAYPSYHYATCSAEANRLMAVAGIGMVAGFVLFALALVIVLIVGCVRARRSLRTWYRIGTWTAAWVPLAGATVFTWIMWVTFLSDTGEEDYCVGNMSAVDAVNIVQIVVLNIWRQAV